MRKVLDFEPVHRSPEAINAVGSRAGSYSSLSRHLIEI